ncbi:MAG TPA: ferritin [Synergistales bacterium]|jgi:ferritin|nr:ferritin [Synergistales bacterium]HRV72015.1 ferritin [Thermovirgaceae bacterium]
MIGKKMQDALNRQINEELFSSYLYLAMSADFQTKNLTGAAAWMSLQAEEERTHAMKFFHYLIERGGEVELLPIDKPQKSWKTPLDAFRDAEKHEQHITACINSLADLAVEEKDYATQNLLQWFVNEQVEEEASVGEVVAKLEMVSDSRNGLFMMDRELGKRVAD